MKGLKVLIRAVISLLYRRVTRDFLGQESFLGIRHFDKQSSTTRKKRPRSEKCPTFSPENS